MIHVNLPVLRMAIILMMAGLSAMVRGQEKITVYFLAGQGSDHRIFDSITLDSSFQKEYLEYGSPEKGQSMKSFAAELANRIDTSGKYVLVGVSLGGMLCVELGELLHPAAVIIISSAKNRKELPRRYTFQRAMPLYAIVPPRVIMAGAKVLQPIVEPDRNIQKETFKKMLFNKDPRYLKQTIRMIILWERTSNTGKVFQIHGTKDHTIPIKNIKDPDYIIEGGSHMMALTRGREISGILQKVLMDLP